MKLPYKLTHPNAKPPVFASAKAACFDLVAAERGPVYGNTRAYKLGIAFDIPDGYHIEVYIRSSLAFKRDFTLMNSVGIVDADYKGMVQAKLAYLGEGPADWPRIGDRIVQARLVRETKTEFVPVDTLTESERGEGGFGSTGL